MSNEGSREADPRLYVRAADVVSSPVGGETVLLHIRKGMYFGLDAVGTRVWDRLEGGATLQELCDTLAREYDVEATQLRADLCRLLDDLTAQDLVCVGPDQCPPGGSA